MCLGTVHLFRKMGVIIVVGRGIITKQFVLRNLEVYLNIKVKAPTKSDGG